MHGLLDTYILGKPMEQAENTASNRPVVLEEIATLLEGACGMFRPSALSLAQEILRIVREAKD